MKLIIEIANEQYQVKLSKAKKLSIPVQFNGQQPNHFGAPIATCVPLEGGGFIGDTEQGGSCNVKEITMVPHCNGTHTECVGHILNDKETVDECLSDSLIPATLISMKPQLGSETDEAYFPNKEKTDELICCEALSLLLDKISDVKLQALIIRLLPNNSLKKRKHYQSQHPPPFFSNAAMQYLVQRGVQHLLVDIPSVDKMYDEGQLSNHRIFWQVEKGSKSVQTQSQIYKTITEMVYIDDTVADGFYLLNLQIADFKSDASPSRPILYPLELL